MKMEKKMSIIIDILHEINTMYTILILSPNGNITIYKGQIKKTQ